MYALYFYLMLWEIFMENEDIYYEMRHLIYYYTFLDYHNIHTYLWYRFHKEIMIKNAAKSQAVVKFVTHKSNTS